MLKAINFNLSVEEIPIVETITDPEDEDIVGGTAEGVTVAELSGTTLSSHDWQKAQADDQNINYIIDKLIAGQKPKTSDMERDNSDKNFSSTEIIKS